MDGVFDTPLDDVCKMLALENIDFSLDASVRFAARYSAAQEHLLRDCARPLDVRFVEHCCRWQSSERCLFLADSCR